MTLTALVIDDVPQYREHYQRILMQLGVHYLLAESAEVGLKVVENNKIDVLFLDYSMPGMNGFEFIDQCRLLPNGASFPIVMISSNLTINQVAVSRGLAQEWLNKKATMTQVENVIKKLGLW